MTNETVQQIIDRAAADPDFRTALAHDPLGAANGAGFNITADDVIKLSNGRKKHVLVRMGAGAENWM